MGDTVISVGGMVKDWRELRRLTFRLGPVERQTELVEAMIR
jgi:hypothetical protein